MDVAGPPGPAPEGFVLVLSPEDTLDLAAVLPEPARQGAVESATPDFMSAGVVFNSPQETRDPAHLGHAAGPQRRNCSREDEDPALMSAGVLFSSPAEMCDPFALGKIAATRVGA
jgi:hypothetical protein